MTKRKVEIDSTAGEIRKPTIIPNMQIKAISDLSNFIFFRKLLLLTG